MTNWLISEFGWNKVSGVYCVFTHNLKTKKSTLQYIGSSKNIGKRVMSPTHPYRTIDIPNEVNFIKYKETKDYLTLETLLIRKLNPPLNKNFANG